MDTRIIRLGFVGVGSMGQCAHLRNYAAIGDCQVVALAELREQTAGEVARRYGVPRVYTDAAEMLAEEHLDGLVVSQPFSRHGVLLSGMLSPDRPVFIEKPLARSVETGECILAAARESKCTVMVGYNKRCDPAVVYARQQIQRLKQSGELGRLTYVRMLMPAGDWIASGFSALIDRGDPKPELEFDPLPEGMDGKAAREYEAFVNYYIHQVNLMRYLLGEPYHVTYAEPSGVLLAGRSDSGVACTIEMTPYRTTVDWQESTLVAFEKGYVKLHLPAPLAHNRAGSVEMLSDPGEGSTPVCTTPHLPWVHSMRAQAEAFVRVVKGESEPPCGAAEALEDLRVALEYLRLRRGAPEPVAAAALS